MRKLTAKQRAFVDEYLIDMNATQAAIRAGYSKKTARSVGNENLTKPDIKKVIDQALEERSNQCALDAEQVIAEMSKRAMAGHLEFFGITHEEWAELSINDRLNHKARMMNIQNKNLEQLAKHHQIYVPKPGANLPTFGFEIDLGWNDEPAKSQERKEDETE